MDKCTGARRVEMPWALGWYDCPAKAFERPSISPRYLHVASQTVERIV